MADQKAPTTADVREALVQAELAEAAFSNTQPAATAFFAVRAVLETPALPLAEERDAERARAEAAEEAVDNLSDEVRSLRTRSLELSVVEERCDWESEVAPKWDEDGNEQDASDRVARLVDALRAERARAEAAEAEVGRLRADLELFQRGLSQSTESANDLFERIALAAGLPADATPAEVVARVGEMRGVLAAYGRTHCLDMTVSMALAHQNEEALVALAARLASEAGP